MRKRQNIKVKNVGCFGSAGRASCLGLLVLGMVLVNPVAGAVYADEDMSGGVSNDIGYDDQIMSTAATNPGVTISFSPVSGSASLTPTTTDGALAKINVTASIQITDTGGYTIYLGGENAALTGKQTGAVIPGASAPTTFYNMGANTWGYAYAEGNIVPDTATYAALPQGQGIILTSATGNQKNVNKSYALSFATKIGSDKPADVYENEVTLSVTSSPLQTTLTGITNMQEMTADICKASFPNDTKQLKDVRDGKTYWVAKLADGKCWMTQNLDLDLSTSWPDASLSDYTTASVAYKPVATASSLVAGSVNSSATGTRSYNHGLYILVNPTTNSDCGVGKANAGACTTQFMAVGSRKPSSDQDFYTKNGKKTYNASEYDAHYLIGNHYQWNTATAGTGGTITSGQASGSICPKGWKLPSSGSETSDFANLVAAGKVADDVVAIVSPPYFFVRGGYAYQDSNLYARGGRAGSYWSSTPTSTAAQSYSFDFDSVNGVTVSGTNKRQDGFSVRCIAR